MSTDAVVTPSQSRIISDMRSLADKYSSNYPVPSPKASSASSASAGDMVIVTGTTGSFGACLLSELFKDATVSKIYAINRADRRGAKPLADRQKSVLKQHDLPAEQMLGSKKIQMVEADLTKPRFGLDALFYDEIHNSVTHIIHCAWNVNFNIPVTALEPNIASLRAFIDFSLTSPLSVLPKIIFICTMGITRNVTSNLSVLDLPLSLVPEVSIGLGYVESKWVAEEILIRAARTVNRSASKPIFNALSVRVGQLCGGPSGLWSIKEWIPSMVQAAKICDGVRALPTDEGEVNWIRHRDAARAVLDMRNVPSSTYPPHPNDVPKDQLLFPYEPSPSGLGIVHLVHPAPTSWPRLMQLLSLHVDAPIIPAAEWVDRLTRAAAKQAALPPDVPRLRIQAFKSVPFWHSMLVDIETRPEHRLAMGFPILDAQRAVRSSRRLQEMVERDERLGEATVKAWIEAWTREGLFDPGYQTPRLQTKL